MSAFQQNIALPSRAGSAAVAGALQARTQGAAGMLDDARAAVVAGNTLEHQGRTALQNRQAEMAQVCSQQGRLAAIAKGQLPVDYLNAFGQQMLTRY